MASLSKIPLGKLVRGVSAVIAGWNNDANSLEYADVRDGALAVRPVVETGSPLPVAKHGENQLIFTAPAVWQSGDPAGTECVMDIPAPDLATEDGKYLVSIVWGSVGVGLSIVLSNLVTIGSTQEEIPVSRFSIKAGENWCIPVQFWLLGDGGRITLAIDAQAEAEFAVTALVHRV